MSLRLTFALAQLVTGHFMAFLSDRLVFTPQDVDLALSPMAGHLGEETYALGAFNPGFTRLANGNLLMMVRVAEALRQAVRDDQVRAIRWDEGRYVLDTWPLAAVDMSDPRSFRIRSARWPVMALTSLSWLLPVELTPDGQAVVAVHYDRAIAPQGSWQCYGIEDARISRVNDQWLMTTCSVSPERHCTTLYVSDNGLDWTFADIVLDHQNKDMLIFEGLIDGTYWAQTRPLGDIYFAYPPGSAWVAGPSINLATSPDARHWRPALHPGIRPRSDGTTMARMGGGAPPILTKKGWLSLWHGVEPNGGVGTYRTYWSMLDRDDPCVITFMGQDEIIGPNAQLTAPLAPLMYLHDIVFTTGIVNCGDHFIVASGEADLACRITHIPKSAFGL
jgi:beta-1,2-mannobiose phosphorylase / 1,2-beta-oligomannan phosphorylase